MHDITLPSLDRIAASAAFACSERHQRRRFEVATTDGYTVTFLASSHVSSKNSDGNEPVTSRQWPGVLLR